MKNQNKFIGFDALKRAVSMVQILDRYGLLDRLYRSRDSLSGTCPLHAGHNPAQFRVSISKNCWICFGDCQAGGSIIDFVSRKEGIGIREAGLLIQDWFGVQASPPIAKRQHNDFQTAAELEAQAAPSALRLDNPPLRFALKQLDPTHPYLQERGLLPATIETFGVGFCRNGLLAGWIAIPIHNAQGQLVAYAGRWPGEPPAGHPKYRLPKGFRKSLELFNLHRALREGPHSPLIVVEGFFGCMKVWEAGFRRVVSLMGSMLSERQAQLLLEAAGPAGKIVLVFDEDATGRKARTKVRERLPQEAQVKLVTFEEEGAQPDRFSVERLREILEQA